MLLNVNVRVRGCSKIFNFFDRAQKRSKFSENDIDIYYYISKTFPKI